jgi:GNAT superfamily N-acetyltransferase
VEVRLVDPTDERVLAEWHAVFDAVNHEMWPQRASFSRRDIRAFATMPGPSRRFELLAAAEPGGSITGVGMMEIPLRDNRHSAEVTVAVHPRHRRLGVGTRIVEAMGERVVADGRSTLNCLVDLPVARASTDAAAAFARSVGFVPTLPGNSRELVVPVERARLDALRRVVAEAPGAAAYRTLTFRSPWPEGTVEDQCELLRRMSTDEPPGDEHKEEEVWDAARLAEYDDVLQARGCSKLAAVAQHVESGHLVAFTELLLSPHAPTQSWQLATIVHPEHRGHRLGLAVKIANLDFLAAVAPSVRLIVTGNAQENAPMIAVNDMLGFEIAGEGYFWQKQLGRG